MRRHECDNCGSRSPEFDNPNLDLVLCAECTGMVVSWMLDGGVSESPTMFEDIGVGVDTEGEIIAIEPLSASVEPDPLMLSGSNGWRPNTEEQADIINATGA